MWNCSSFQFISPGLNWNPLTASLNGQSINLYDRCWCRPKAVSYGLFLREHQGLFAYSMCKMHVNVICNLYYSVKSYRKALSVSLTPLSTESLTSRLLLTIGTRTPGQSYKWVFGSWLIVKWNVSSFPLIRRNQSHYIRVNAIDTCLQQHRSGNTSALRVAAVSTTQS